MSYGHSLDTGIGEPYQCAGCGQWFRKAVSDHEAHQEALERGHAPTDPADVAVMCDDCYERWLPWARAEGLIP